MAKALDLPFVVIFEDDAYPCDNVYTKLEEVLKYIPT
jgi:GR25 family glycosyltransferase involved in LPS biosynthesis